jgi:2-oxoglutarate/2-oxoacid ferredoxin oxidoreductase subunit alpha
MTPVILLTDGYLANGSEGFKIPKMADLKPIKPPIVEAEDLIYRPYLRDPEKLNRSWAIPGTLGLRHRIGGLEKENVSGNVSHDPENHQIMCELRAEKVRRVANYIEKQNIIGEDSGELLVVSWGGTFGVMIEAVKEMQSKGQRISLTHFHYINPLPNNTEEIFSKFKKIIVPELNLGQFVLFLRMNFQQFKFHQYNKIQGLPFMVAELVEKFNEILEEK